MADPPAETTAPTEVATAALAELDGAADFLSRLTHDLKTPLTVIRGFADYLVRTPDIPAEEQHHALEAISRRAAELGRLVDNVSLARRIERDALTAELETVDLACFADGVVAESARRDERTFALELDEPVLVQADAAHLRVIVEQLLENAIGFSDASTAVHVAVTTEDGRGVLTITDHGVGMDEEALQRCWEPFWRGSPTGVPKAAGAGLGLWIAARLGALTGAELVLRSGREGTTAVVRLPLG